MRSIAASRDSRLVSTDALGRRTRMIRQPRGRRIGLQPRDLLWFEKLHRHGPLPTSYLYAFSEHLAKDRCRTLKRLADLYNEGGYLDRPKQQFQTIDARYNQLVYELNERAERVLQREGRFSDHAAGPGGPWVHRLMVSCVTASLELAAEARSDLRYIPQHAILDRAGVGLGTSVTYEHPVTGQTHNGDLIPDAICGLEYCDGKRPRRRFFLIEADRNTEPNRSGRFDRKSFRKSILQYREYIGRGLYKEHLKLDDPVAVLTVTTSTRHMQNLINLVAEIAPSGKNSFLCFQAVPAFGSPFKPPQPLPTLLTGPWERAGHAPAYIDRP